MVSGRSVSCLESTGHIWYRRSGNYIIFLSTVGYIFLGDRRLHLVPEVVGFKHFLYKLG